MSNLLQFFKYDHLPEHMQRYSKSFAQLAQEMVAFLPDNGQKEKCLEKLLEAKDCAVRSLIQKD